MPEDIIKDILILVAGGLVGYLAAVLGGLHVPWWTKYLHDRKLNKTRKTRQQALRLFNRIKDFRTGKRDRYAFYILSGTASVICAIFAATLFLIVSIQNGATYPLSIEYGMVVLVAIIAILFGVIFLTGIYETARQLERFDEYKAELEATWGPVDDDNP
jgi:hypothetical protein